MTRATVTVVSPVVFSNELVIGLAQGLQGIVSEVASLKAAMLASAGKQLPFMIAGLANVHPVNAETWARMAPAGFKAWAEAQGCTIDDEGRAFKDGARNAYAATSFSILKVATIALTNGIAALKGENLQGYVTRARAICATRGLIEQRAKGESTAKPAATPKAATAEKARASAFNLVANNDHAFAAKLAAVSSEYRPQFEAWYDRLMASLAV